MATSITEVCESSDIVHEYPCNSCADDGKDIEGVNFCAECQTFFCQACIQFHNKCFKTHTIFNKSGVKSGKNQYEQQQQQQDGLACEKHAGNLIQMYCGEHETVCCAVCIAVDHRLCKNADFIPQLAKEVLNGRDSKGVQSSLDGIKIQLQIMKARKLEQLKNVGEEQEESLKDISKMKESIIARVEEIERNSIEKVQAKHNSIVDTMKTDIECIDGNLNSIESCIKRINTFKGENEAKLFVVLNKAHEVEVDSFSFIVKYGNRKYDKIKFEINPSISSFLSKAHNFGSIGGDSGKAATNIMTTHPQFSEASFVKQVSVKGNDSCILDNGQVIILRSGVDRFDKTHLTRLDKTYELLDVRFLSKNAQQLCKIGPSEIAVMCENELIFVEAGKSLSITLVSEKKDIRRVVPVIGKHIPDINCTGMSFSNERIFVCDAVIYRYNCGYLNSYSYIYSFVVSVYDLTGRFIKTYTHEVLTDTDCVITINHAIYSHNDSCLYIATKEMGLLVFDTTNKTLKGFDNKRLENPKYVCDGRNGRIFICSKDSHNVFLVDTKRNTMEEILGSMDGIWEPESIMYIQHRHCILVASMSQRVTIFQFK